MVSMSCHPVIFCLYRPILRLQTCSYSNSSRYWVGTDTICWLESPLLLLLNSLKFTVNKYNTLLRIPISFKFLRYSSHFYWYRPIYNSVKKVSDLFFLRKPGGFQWIALAWGNLEPSYACVNFSHLSMASVDGKQHLSEVVFSTLIEFSL